MSKFFDYNSSVPIVLSVLIICLFSTAGYGQESKDSTRLKNAHPPKVSLETLQLSSPSEMVISTTVFPSLKMGTNEGGIFTRTMDFKLKFGKWGSPRIDLQQVVGYPSAVMGLHPTWSGMGNLGSATYDVGQKFYLGTSVYSEQWGLASRMNPFLNPNQLNSSLNLGYKFSDKFKIQASFTIHRQDGLWGAYP